MKKSKNIKISKENIGILSTIGFDRGLKNYDEVIEFILRNCDFSKNENLKTYLAFRYGVGLNINPIAFDLKENEKTDTKFSEIKKSDSEVLKKINENGNIN